MLVESKLAEFTIEDVLSKRFIGDKINIKSSINGLEYEYISDSSGSKGSRTTLINFRKNGKDCCCCGIKGTKFILTQIYKQHRPTIKLYGECNGKLILMTIDHIVPISLGGKNSQSNYQTMCDSCNNRKANNINLSFKEINSLPRVYSKQSIRKVLYFTNVNGINAFTKLKSIDKIVYRNKELNNNKYGIMPLAVKMIGGYDSKGRLRVAADGMYDYYDGEIIL